MKELIADILGLVRVFHFTKDETFNRETIQEKISTAVTNLSNTVDTKLSNKSDKTHKHIKSDITNLTNASSNNDGLLSSQDKIKLDTVENGANKIIVDNAFNSNSTNPVQNKVITNGMYNKDQIHELMANIDVGHGKLLSINVTEEGILEVDNDSFEYYTTDEVDAELAKKTVSFETQNPPESGCFATYVLKQNNVQVGPKINIPQDFLVRSGSVKKVTIDDTPVQGYKVGDKYLDLVINTKDDSGTDNHLYILATDFIDDYSADNVTIQLVNRTFSIKDKGVTKAKLSDNIQTSLDYADTFNNSPCKNITTNDITNWNNKANISDIPINVSDLNNDSGYLTEHQDITGKVDKITGKGLSTEDYTTEEKTKLVNIENEANKTTVDDSMSVLSTNPVQNKIVKEYIDSTVQDIISGDIDLSRSHNHDDRYFTQSEVTDQLDEKADDIHDHGNLKSNGQVGSTAQANKNVVTDMSGKITTEDKPIIPTLTDSTNTDSSSIGASATAVKTAYDLANGKAAENHSHGAIQNDGTLNSDTSTVSKVAVTDGDNNVKTIDKVPFSNLNISKSDIMGLGIPGSDTNTTYGADRGISNVGNKFGHSNAAVTAQTTSALKKIKYDAYGHITGTDDVVKADITALGIPGTDTNTTYSVATQSANGLMASADKTKLDGIATGANNYAHPNSGVTAGTNYNGNQTPAFGGTFNIPKLTFNAQGHITASANSTVTIPSLPAASTSTAGILKIGTAANDACAGNDSRLSNSRVPVFTHIPASSSAPQDLNTYKTGGFYYVSHDSNEAPYVSNCPLSGSSNRAFFLLVETWGPVSQGYLKQTLTYHNTNKTYTRTCAGGNWLSWVELSKDTVYTHPNSGVTAGTNYNGNQTPAFGGTFNIPKLTFNAQGHITASANSTVTIPSLPAASTSTAGILKIGTAASDACAGNDSRLSNARTPTSHAVNANTYGLGTASLYGHVKVSDNYASSAGNASQSIAASSAAVKSVYDIANGKAASNHTHTSWTLAQTYGDEGASKTIRLYVNAALRLCELNWTDVAAMTANTNRNISNDGWLTSTYRPLHAAIGGGNFTGQTIVTTSGQIIFRTPVTISSNNLYGQAMWHY